MKRQHALAKKALPRTYITVADEKGEHQFWQPSMKSARRRLFFAGNNENSTNSECKENLKVSEGPKFS